MANTKNILSQIKVNGVLEDLLAKSNGENVTVHYNGGEKTLTEALSEIMTSVNAAQTSQQVQSAIKAEIDKLVNDAPTTYDTLGEIAAYIEAHKSVADALNEAIGKKADKDAFEAVQQTVQALGALASKSTVAENDLESGLKAKINAAAQGNHSHENKEDLDGITAEKIAQWDNKAEKTEASASAAGLMPAADKKRLDGMGGVYCGSSAPDEMKNGDLFIKVVSAT